MTGGEITSFYADLIIRQLVSRRMLFVQATANVAYPAAELLAAIDLAARERLGASPKFVAPDGAVVLGQEEKAPRLVIVSDLGLVADRLESAWLASARPVLTAAVESGAYLLLFSTVPRLRLRSSVGSLITMDCAFFRFDPVSEHLEHSLLGHLPDKIAENIREWSQMQPALLDQFLKIAALESSNTQKLKLSNGAIAEIAKMSFMQVGPDIAGWLEHWLFQYHADFLAETDVPSDILEALHNTGLVGASSGGRIELFPGPGKNVVKQALRDYLDEITSAPYRWPELASALFRLERMIRLAVKSESISRWGDEWRLHLAEGSLKGAIGRAVIEAPHYDKAGSIPNPLEWMSLSELGEVVVQLGEGDNPLAKIPTRVWHLLFEEIAPIRNRMAHMRIARLGDLELVRRWQRELKMRAPTSFHD